MQDEVSALRTVYYIMCCVRCTVWAARYCMWSHCAIQVCTCVRTYVCVLLVLQVFR